MTLPSSQFKAARGGLILALLTVLYGFGLGGVFGAAEDSIKGTLAARGEAALSTAYSGDEAKMKAVVSKSWTYFKRAHLHAGSLGTTALGLILLVCLLGAPTKLVAGTAWAGGAGGLGYSIFWMLAGLRAPGLGSTGAAKDSLFLLATPSAFACIAAVVLTLICVVRPSAD